MTPEDEGEGMSDDTDAYDPDFGIDVPSDDEAHDTSSPEPDRPLCEECKVKLSSERVFARRCLDCADTEEFDSDPFGYGGTD